MCLSVRLRAHAHGICRGSHVELSGGATRRGRQRGAAPSACGASGAPAEATATLRGRPSFASRAAKSRAVVETALEALVGPRSALDSRTPATAGGRSPAALAPQMGLRSHWQPPGGEPQTPHPQFGAAPLTPHTPRIIVAHYSPRPLIWRDDCGPRRLGGEPQQLHVVARRRCFAWESDLPHFWPPACYPGGRGAERRGERGESACLDGGGVVSGCSEYVCVCGERRGSASRRSVAARGCALALSLPTVVGREFV